MMRYESRLRWKNKTEPEDKQFIIRIAARPVRAFPAPGQLLTVAQQTQPQNIARKGNREKCENRETGMETATKKDAAINSLQTDATRNVSSLSAP